MAEIKAKLSYLRKSARKVRIVADLIRGKSLSEAKENLKFAARNSAGVLEKLLRSAEASAKNNLGIKPEKLFVKEIKINEGPTLKRFMPRAFGRAYQIRKRTSHVLLTLGEK